MKDSYIITIFDIDNYGNRLQNCATVKLLQKRGLNATTVLARSRDDNRGHFLDVAFPMRPNGHLAGIGKIKRWLSFRSFSSRYTPVKCYCKQLQQKMQDGFIVLGSDQLWNPLYGIGSRVDGLQCGYGFDPKRVCTMAPSFGVAELTKEQSASYSKWLSPLQTISVREDAGASLVHELTNRDAVVLPDPTMGLSRGEWETIAESKVCPSNKYLLTYYLGDSSRALADRVQGYAESRGLEIVNVLDESDRWMQCGPAGFLGLIEGAEGVVTDSFHGSVFSLLFNTPFLIVKRSGASNMFSRLETLMNRFECPDALYDEDRELSFDRQDWDVVNAKLNAARDEVNDWLDSELARMGTCAIDEAASVD